MSLTAYVMLWTVLIPNVGVSSSSAEFVSKETCEAAAARVGSVHVRATNYDNATMFAMCVPK